MIVDDVYKPSSRTASITVSLSEVADTDTDLEIVAFARMAADETPESLFGSYVLRYDDGEATVQLHRD